MTDQPRTKFFFEADPAATEPGLSWKEHAETFFNVLRDTGVIQTSESMEQKGVTASASMQVKSSKVLQVEFGTYQDNYAVHVTPIHPVKNIRTDGQMKAALFLLVKILNDYVPYNLQVNIHMPRADWKIKVVSAVVQGGATSWNFDRERLEREGIDRIIREIDRVLLA